MFGDLFSSRFYPNTRGKPATLPIIFDAIDVDHDGGISSKEFANYFKSLGLQDDNFANSVFAAMDANNDGSLSNEG